MTQTARYQIAEPMRLICANFNLDPSVLLRKSGLPPDLLDIGNIPVAGRPFYDVWEALPGLVDRTDLPVILANGACDVGAKSPEFDSAAYAFFSSPTVRIGVHRKAMFKPLHLPIRIRLEEDADTFSVAFLPNVAGRRLPSLMGWFDLAYFIGIIRQATGVHIVPLEVRAPDDWPEWAERDAFFGTSVTPGPEYQFTLRLSDADLPLTSRNDALWAQIEGGLRARLAAMPDVLATSARVRDALIDGLPAGDATADAIGRRLGLSKRSLQRRLSEEGESFKSILAQTRRALALNYLHATEISVQEIAFLLGFRDTSSFFRAFRSWTGQTPMFVRASRDQV